MKQRTKKAKPKTDKKTLDSMKRYLASDKGKATRAKYLESNKYWRSIYNKEYLQMRRRIAKKEGFCMRCLRRKRIKSRAMCVVCTKRNREYHNIRREKRFFGEVK